MDRVPVYLSVHEMTMVIGALKVWHWAPVLPGGLRLAEDCRKDLAALASRLEELQRLEYPVA